MIKSISSSPLMENVDLNILTQWMIASFWNYIFILCFAVILSLQIIFLCGYERKRYGNKKKAKTQEVISFSIDNDKALKAESAPPPAPPPLPYDAPQISLCPEDTLHDVTSIAMDNETSIFMLSPHYLKTPLTHSMKEIHSEHHSPPAQNHEQQASN